MGHSLKWSIIRGLFTFTSHVEQTELAYCDATLWLLTAFRIQILRPHSGIIDTSEGGVLAGSIWTPLVGVCASLTEHWGGIRTEQTASDRQCVRRLSLPSRTELSEQCKYLHLSTHKLYFIFWMILKSRTCFYFFPSWNDLCPTVPVSEVFPWRGNGPLSKLSTRNRGHLRSQSLTTMLIFF